MIKEYDLVKLKVDIPKEGLKIGMLGTVVMVYDEIDKPKGYEVEFVDSKGMTIALVTLHENDIEVTL